MRCASSSTIEDAVHPARHSAARHPGYANGAAQAGAGGADEDPDGRSF
jgi:hypothetical protein